MSSSNKTFHLLSGHGGSPLDTGAVGNGYKEYERVRTFTKHLATHIRALGSRCLVMNNAQDPFRETKAGRGMRVIPKDRTVIEVHLNSFKDASANGTETWIHSTRNANKVDTAIHNVLKKYFRDRGIKKSNNLTLTMNVAKDRGIDYRLVELCFISNANDMKVLNANMDRIAKEMAEALTGVSYSSITNKYTIHTVLKGETLSAIAKKHSTTVNAILKLNPSIKNANLIKVNQKIRVK